MWLDLARSLCTSKCIGKVFGRYRVSSVDLGLAPVAGVEIHQTAASHAQQFGIVVNDVRLLDNRFDIVQIKNVIINIQAFAEFLDDCLSCLKPGGVLFLDVLNQSSLTSLVRKVGQLLRFKASRYGSLRPPFVINGFSKENTLLFLENHGLYPLSVRTSYLGSREVPCFADAHRAKYVGMVGKALGMGTMILIDARKATRK